MHAGQDRIRYLDGLRGVAIIMVLLYHYFGRGFAEWLPYGSRYAAFPPARFGWMGVELFFLISGFVIFLTIERCSGFVDFMLRRWLRLFPALLVASLLILCVDHIPSWPGPFTTHGTLFNLSAALTLIAPAAWGALLQRPIAYLDGPFWSLYAEVAFYALFGAFYFMLGWRRAVWGLLTVALIAWLVELTGQSAEAPALLQRVRLVSQWFHLSLLGWFVAGALFYKAHALGRNRIYALALAAGLLASVLCRPLSLVDHGVLALMVGLFALAQKNAWLQHILSSRIPVFVGAISYPLYLIHNNIGIGLIGILSTAMPPLVAVCLSAAAVILFAWAIERWAEPAVRRIVRPITDRVRMLLAVAPS